MKNTSFITVFMLIICTSCTTYYKCGDSRPEKFTASKRVMPLVNERDSLCTTSKNLEAALSKEQKELQNLQGQFTSLESDYQALQAKSAMTQEEMGSELRRQSEELSKKALTLAEREKSLRELQAVIARQDSITNRLNGILRDALLGFQADELSVEVKNGKVYVSMSDKLLFKSGSAAVEAKGKDAIDALANVLQKNTDIDILIEGHTDNVPIKTATYKDNWDLSAARATSIVRLLEAKQIDPKKLTAAGRGEFQPRSTNDTAEGRASNRRTEIILSPKLDELMQLLGN